MKYVPVAAIALMLAVPAFAQTTPAAPAKTAAKAAAPKAAAAAPATHATKGVVKSVDDTKLVIARTGGSKAPETTFVLNTATQRQGAIAVGASVDVRYHTEGKNKVATAVSVQTPKAPAAAKATK